MAEVTLAIGAAAVCSDGFPGELKALVVDPGPRAVTHLVIEPELEHGAAEGLARLVPLDHADASAEPIRLAYAEAEFKDLSPAEETLAEFVPGYEVRPLGPMTLPSVAGYIPRAPTERRKR